MLFLALILWLSSPFSALANFDAAIGKDTTLSKVKFLEQRGQIKANPIVFSIARVCSEKASGEYCNPNWTPFPNMDQV